MSEWRIHARAETDSTNADARAGRPGDVYTAEFQRAGRGRLDHRWHASRGENLAMSAVCDVAGLDAGRIATAPIAVGVAVRRALAHLLPSVAFALKWPNDILAGSRKVCGILCERTEAGVIAGIGVNVNESGFPGEIAARATSLKMLSSGKAFAVGEVLDAILSSLGEVLAVWRSGGLAPLAAEIARADFLKSRRVSVVQCDGDRRPVTGVCGGIAVDGSLLVGGERIWAGEAHVSEIEGEKGD